MAGELPAAPEGEGRRSNIRTMKSDISEFLEETKPSLIQLMTTQAEAERLPREVAVAEKRRSFTAWMILLGLVLVLFFGGYLGYRFFSSNQVEEAAVLIPQPFFSVEQSVTVDTSLLRTPLKEKLIELTPPAARVGAITRIIVLTAAPGSASRTETLAEFLAGLQIQLPPELLRTFSGPVMPFYYQSSQGTRFGVVSQTDDPLRTLAGFLPLGATAAATFTPFFLNEAPPARLISFEDRVYKNINYRILALDPARDLVLVYGLFSAKNYFIITTSEETFQTVVNRLFQAS